MNSIEIKSLVALIINASKTINSEFHEVNKMIRVIDSDPNQ